MVWWLAGLQGLRGINVRKANLGVSSLSTKLPEEVKREAGKEFLARHCRAFLVRDYD